MKRLQIYSNGRLSYEGKNVIATPLGRPRLTLDPSIDDALERMLKIAPKKANGFVVGQEKIPVNIWPDFHPKYGINEIWVPVQFYRIDEGKNEHGN